MKRLGVVVAVVAAACTAVQMHGGGTTGGSGESGEPAAPAGDPGMVVVPDVMGMARADAEAKLHAAGVRDVRTDNSEQLTESARVCSEVPGGGQQNRTSLPVVLRYCDRTATRELRQTPDLRGLTVDSAKQRIQAAGFTGTVDVVEITSDPACKIGTVCSAAPDHWDFGDTPRMTIYVAKSLAISAPE